METLVGEPEISYYKPAVETRNYSRTADICSRYANAYTVKNTKKSQRNSLYTSFENDLTVHVNDKIFQLPSRLKHIAQQIEEAKELLNYADDWDDEGAVAMDGPAFEKAACFVIDYATYIFKHFATVLSVPYIDILRDGSASVHWENKENNQFLIVFKKEADDLAYYYAEQSDRKIPFKSAIVPNASVDETLALWMKNHLS